MTPIAVIPAKLVPACLKQGAGIQKISETGFRIKCGMTGKKVVISKEQRD